MRGIRTKRTVSFVFMDIIRDFLGYYPIRWVLSIDRKYRIEKIEDEYQKRKSKAAGGTNS